MTTEETKSVAQEKKGEEPILHNSLAELVDVLRSIQKCMDSIKPKADKIVFNKYIVSINDISGVVRDDAKSGGDGKRIKLYNKSGGILTYMDFDTEKESVKHYNLILDRLKASGTIIGVEDLY